MKIYGIKKKLRNIELYCDTKTIICFELYEDDTPQKIICDLKKEFDIINIPEVEKMLNIVLYTRFSSIIPKLN